MIYTQKINLLAKDYSLTFILDGLGFQLKKQELACYNLFKANLLNAVPT
jgi:hypothetical protein